MQGRAALQAIKDERAALDNALQKLILPDSSLNEEAKALQVKFQNEMSGILAKLEEDFSNAEEKELAETEKHNDEQNKTRWTTIRNILLKAATADSILTYDFLEFHEPKSFDQLIEYVNKKLNEKFLRSFQAILEKKDSVVRDYVRIAQGRMVLTRAGEELRDYVFHEERIKQVEMARAEAFKLLQENLAEQKQELKNLDEKIRIINKEKSTPVGKKIKEQLKDKDIFRKLKDQQENIQRLRLDNVFLSESVELEKLEKLANEMESTIHDAVKADEATALLGRIDNLLEEAKEFCSQGKSDYGAGEAWDKLCQKMSIRRTVLATSAAEFEQLLTNLCDDKARLDQRIAAEEKLALEPQVAPDPENDGDAVICYLQKTNDYLEDWSEDMRKRLIALREFSEKIDKNQYTNPYEDLLGVLDLKKEAEPAEVTDALKELYDVKNNKDEAQIKNKINEILIKKEVGQGALQHALQKYRVFTELKGELEKEGATFAERRNGFLDTLRVNNQLLNERRDRIFMAFIRGCGAAVAAIFRQNKQEKTPYKMHYHGMFSPRSKQYADSIKNEEKNRKRQRMAADSSASKRLRSN